jgi:hypothetical protein
MSLKAFVKADALNFKIFHLGVLMNVKFSARKDMGNNFYANASFIVRGQAPDFKSILIKFPLMIRTEFACET